MRQLHLFADPDKSVSADLPAEDFLPLEWLELDGICARYAVVAHFVDRRYLARIQWGLWKAAELQSCMLKRPASQADRDQIAMWKQDQADLQVIADAHQENLARAASRKQKRKNQPGPATRPLPIPRTEMVAIHN